MSERRTSTISRNVGGLLGAPTVPDPLLASPPAPGVHPTEDRRSGPTPPPQQAAQHRRRSPKAATDGLARDQLRKRQYGVRVSDGLYQRLRWESARAGQPYGVVLGHAYQSLRHDPARLVHDPDPDDFFASARSALGPGSHLVQFFLTRKQHDLVQDLAGQIGYSFSEVVRDLLDCHLDHEIPKAPDADG